MAEIVGTSGNDTLEGTESGDTLISNGGGDALMGLGGNDSIVLSDFFPGYIDGGAGEDTLVLKSYTDFHSSKFYSAAHPKGVISGPYYLNLSGIVSIERLQFNSEDAHLTTAFLSFSNPPFADQLGHGAISESATLIGGDGYDAVSLYVGERAANIITVPTFSYSNWFTPDRAYQASDLVAIHLGPIDSDLMVNGSPHAGVQSLLGGNGDDTINGSEDMDILAGGGGVNDLYGNGGDDTLEFYNYFTDFSLGYSVTGETGAGSLFDGGEGFDFLSFGGPVDFQGSISSIEGIFLAPAYASSSLSPQYLKYTEVTLGSERFGSDLPLDLTVDGEGVLIIPISSDDFDVSSLIIEPDSQVAIRLEGNTDANRITGSAGADSLVGAGGDDSLDGGDGIDTAVFEHHIENYSIDVQQDKIVVVGESEGVDTLVNVEFLEFGGATFAADELDSIDALSVVNFSPADGAVDVGLDSLIMITFSQDIVRGEGLIILNNNSYHGSEEFLIETGYGTTISGNTLIIDPTQLLAEGVTYSVTLEGEIVTDVHGNSYVGTELYSFSTVEVENDFPIVLNRVEIETNEDEPSQLHHIDAYDEEGDALTFSVKVGAGPSKGTVSFEGDHVRYTPFKDENDEDVFTILVDDGNGGITELVVDVEIVPVNDAPIMVESQEVSILRGVSKVITAEATDVDGDTLVYSVSGALNGFVSSNNFYGPDFTYTPDSGFIGTDSFVVTVSDNAGLTATQTVNITVREPVFRMFAADGFAGEVGGTGTVFGTNGAQDIALLSLGGDSSLDASFNRGGDIVRLEGEAGDYSIVKSGSSVILSDGQSSFTIPVGPTGLDLVFDDGARTLLLDTGDGMTRIGDQVVTGTATPIDPSAEGPAPAVETDPDAGARIFLEPGSIVALSGNYAVFGSSEGEEVTYLSGNLSLDSSFNRGGDMLVLLDAAEQFSAYRSGTSLVLVDDAGTARVPVGPAGMTLDFGGDARELRLDLENGEIVLGDQVIAADSLGEAQVLDSAVTAFG